MPDNFGQSIARFVSTRPEAEVHPHSPEEQAELFTALSEGAGELETLTLLNSLVYLFKPRFALETGTGSGYTAAAMASAMRANGGGMVQTVEADPTVRQSAEANVEKLEPVLLGHIGFNTGDSLSFIENWAGEPFEFAFFDSLIAFRHIEFERLMERGLLAPGAVCVFHDTSRRRGEYFHDFNPEMIAALDRHSTGRQWMESGLSRGLRIIRLPDRRHEPKLSYPERVGPEGTAFRHSGKLGDVVYSLPAIRALGGGRLFLNADGRYGMGSAAAEALLPLLREQPYLTAADIWRGEPVDVDLDAFRGQDPGRNNLADCHLNAFGLRRSERDIAWLHVPADQYRDDYVFSRSLLRPGVPGFWQSCVKAVGARAVFLGSAQEHRAFCEMFGDVAWAPTPDLRQAARIIASSRLFIGNQSCLLAIAEALKKPTVIEIDPEAPNCLFSRPNSLAVGSSEELGAIASFAARFGPLP